MSRFIFNILRCVEIVFMLELFQNMKVPYANIIFVNITNYRFIQFECIQYTCNIMRLVFFVDEPITKSVKTPRDNL